MYKVIVKYVNESEEQNPIIKNPIEVFTCEKFECLQGGLFGIATGAGEVVMIPIRRIHDIKITDLGDGK